MTYCVAWKTTECAYLIADSALTTSEDMGHERLETSFGERQGWIDGTKEYVYENAYKIYSNDKVSIALIGNAYFGNSFIELILTHLEYGRTVEDAINNSITNYENFSDNHHIQIVIAFHDGEPKLFTIDNKASPFVAYDNSFVVFGSQSEDLSAYTKSFHDGFLESWKNDFRVGDKAHEFFLIRMLALLQIYGIHNYTLESGIGGAYTGILVNETGVSFQPDVCYVITGEDVSFNTKMLTSISVKKDHFCIINTDTSSVLISNMNVNLETESERLNSTLSSAVDTFDSGRFKYYIFLNLARHSAVVVNMDNHLHHQVLSLDIRSELKGTIGLIVSEELQNNLNVNYDPIVTPIDVQIMLYPYISASEDKISLIENNINEMRVSKRYTEVLDTYIFLIFKNGKESKRFHGTGKTILPFIKHYKESEYIRIVDVFTDATVLEYKNGRVEFPDLEDELKNIFDKIVPKKSNDNLYLFEITTKENEIHTLRVLSSNYETACKKARVEINGNTNRYGSLMFVGVKFYHPAYSC